MTPDLVARDELVTVAAAARAFKVTRRTVLRWIHSGRLAFTRVPDDAGQLRLSRAEIEKQCATRRSIW